MRRTALALAMLFLLAVGIQAQQTGFVNTVLHYKSSCMDFRDAGLSACIEDGVLVYPSVTDLEEGDVFIDVDGAAKKVISVTEVDGAIYIDTVQPDLRGFLLFAFIPNQTILFSDEYFEPNYFGGKISEAEAKSADPRAVYTLYKTNSMSITASVTPSLTAPVTFGFLLPYLEAVWQSYYAGSIFGIAIYLPYLAFYYHRGYVDASIDYNIGVAGGLNFKLETADPVEFGEKQIYGYGTPAGSGVTAFVGLKTKTIFEGSLELDLPVTFNVKGAVGASATLDGAGYACIPTSIRPKFSGPYFGVSFEPSLTAEADLRQKFYLAVEVGIDAVTLVNFEAGGGPYIKIDGSLSGSIGYYSSGYGEGHSAGLEGPSWEANANGEFGLFVDIGGALIVIDDNPLIEFSIYQNDFPLVTISASASGDGSGVTDKVVGVTHPFHSSR